MNQQTKNGDSIHELFRIQHYHVVGPSDCNAFSFLILYRCAVHQLNLEVVVDGAPPRSLFDLITPVIDIRTDPLSHMGLH